ncbi:hypothetical protein COO58_17620 [Micromonospora sp. WMMA1996]|nr:hypothetical protein COO58_17620 [Micromonospora sp. WMMA1996]
MLLLVGHGVSCSGVGEPGPVSVGEPDVAGGLVVLAELSAFGAAAERFGDGCAEPCVPVDREGRGRIGFKVCPFALAYSEGARGRGVGAVPGARWGEVGARGRGVSHRRCIEAGRPVGGFTLSICPSIREFVRHPPS